MRKYLYCFLLAACYSMAAAPQTQELTQLSSSIADNLQNLKLESEAMVKQLTQLHESLQQSETERQLQEQQLTSLSNSLMSINEQLNNSYETMTRYELQLKQRMSIIVTLLIVLAARLVLMIAGYVLYFKGIHLPRWLDILL